jgi:hypothetical protein
LGAVLSVFAADGRTALHGGTRRRDGSSEIVRGVLQLDTWSGISAAHGRGGVAGIPRVAGGIRTNFFNSVGLVNAKVGRVRASRRDVGLTGGSGRLAMGLAVVGVVVLTIRIERTCASHGGEVYATTARSGGGGGVVERWRRDGGEWVVVVVVSAWPGN